MTAYLTPYQFASIIELLDKEYKETDIAFYCGLRNTLKKQYEKENEKLNKSLEELFKTKD